MNSCYASAPIINHWSPITVFPGGVAERLIAPVLKTGRPKGLVSSNLTPSVLLRAPGASQDLLFCLREAGRPPKLQRRRGQCITFILSRVSLRNVSAISA